MNKEKRKNKYLKRVKNRTQKNKEKILRSKNKKEKSAKLAKDRAVFLDKLKALKAKPKEQNELRI